MEQREIRSEFVRVPLAERLAHERELGTGTDARAIACFTAGQLCLLITTKDHDAAPIPLMKDCSRPIGLADGCADVDTNPTLIVTRSRWRIGQAGFVGDLSRGFRYRAR
jgi:hypothetical protein